MDRQNMIVAGNAVVVPVAAGAFLLWPDSTERATVATEPSPGAIRLREQHDLDREQRLLTAKPPGPGGARKGDR